MELYINNKIETEIKGRKYTLKLKNKEGDLDLGYLGLTYLAENNSVYPYYIPLELLQELKLYFMEKLEFSRYKWVINIGVVDKGIIEIAIIRIGGKNEKWILWLYFWIRRQRIQSY